MDAQNIAIATASLPNRSLDDALATADHLGFAAVGLLGASGARHSGGLLPGFFWDDVKPADRDRIAAALRPFGRRVIHAPFHDLPLVSTNPRVEREAVRQVRETIRAANALGLKVVTVHAVPPGRIPEPEFIQRLVANLRTLGDEARSAGVVIGVENVAYPSDPEEHVGLLDAVGHPAVGATLDVGHIALRIKRDGVGTATEVPGARLYNERLLELIDRLGTRIIHVHVHDVRADDLRDHRAVGRGVIDFSAVIAHLEALGYAGLLELELEELDAEAAAAESLDYLRRLLGSPHEPPTTPTGSQV